MSMTTEDAIYNVDICDWTGVACIRCNPGPCEHRRIEKRHHPWQGFVDVDAKDADKVPEEDLRGIEGGADARGHQHDVLSGVTSIRWRFLQCVMKLRKRFAAPAIGGVPTTVKIVGCAMLCHLK